VFIGGVFGDFFVVKAAPKCYNDIVRRTPIQQTKEPK